MPNRKRRSPATTAQNTAQKMGELAFAAPQVMAHRMVRMAQAGPVLSARDRKEFSGMLLEKQEAMAHSWLAMWGEAARIQQSLLMSWIKPAVNPAAALSPRAWLEASAQAAQFQGPAQRVAAKGLAPFHKKAVANARRLAKTKLR